METIKNCLGLKKNDCAALVGSGGKTSLLFLLARQYPGWRVLVSTTTKIGRPPRDAYDYFINGSRAGKGLPGVSLMADESPEGKLQAPDLAALQSALAGFDLALLESDGSRNLPLKGWAQHEPVVPGFVTATVGLVPLWPLGRPANEEIVHRLPLFCELAGVRPGQVLTAQHLAAAISGQGGKGLFTAARGRKILFFNQVETAEVMQQARQVMALLPQSFCKELHRVVAGSVHKNEGEILL